MKRERLQQMVIDLQSLREISTPQACERYRASEATIRRNFKELAAAGLAVAFAVNYFFTEQMNFGGVLCAILVLGMAGMILAAILGYIPERKWLLWTGMAVMAASLLIVA